MRQYDNLDDDTDDLKDDDSLDQFASTGGATTRGPVEDQLSAKYADYLMWRDTGSSHDEALDLASLTEEDYTTAAAAEDPDLASGLAPLEDDEDGLDDEDEDDFGGSSRGRGRGEDDFDY